DDINLHQPTGRGGLCDEREADEPRAALAWPSTEPPRRDPRGLSLRSLRMEVRLAVNAVGIPLERERPVAQVRNNGISDLDVVLREVALRHAVAGKQDALRMRQPDPAPSDLDLVAHRASRVRVSSCRSGRRYRPARRGWCTIELTERMLAIRARSEERRVGKECRGRSAQQRGVD